MRLSRLVLAAIILLLIVAFFALDLTQYFTLDFLKSRQAGLEEYFRANPLRTALIYFGVYIAVTGLSLPGAAVLTLVGGAIFGLLRGTVIVSFASSIGATLAFLASRFMFRDWVQQRFRANLEAINRGVERDGPFYLFTLRLVPYFPFFVINLVMGLTPMRTATFYVVSQVGMLAGTLVFVNAGSELARIDSASDLISPTLLTAFVLLGLFPLLAKKFIDALRSRRALRAFPRPKKFDRNLIVIGAGSAGLVSAYIGAAVKANGARRSYPLCKTPRP